MRLQHLLYATVCAAALALPGASAASANILISINQNTQHMLVSVDGATRYDWPVSTGRAGHGTPNGVFKVNRMDAQHYSKEYEDAYMPDAMFFDLNGHAIHGFNDIPHLGMAVSHGCVRLAPANAALLFNLVKQEGMANTTVEISGRIPARAPLIARQQAPAQQATEEASAEQATQIMPQGYQAAPGYQRPAYGQPAQPGYGQPAYGQSEQQPGYGQPAYAQPARPAYGQPESTASGQAFPPQPAPYGQQQGYSQPYGGGQASYQPPSYGQYYSYGGSYAGPVYRQY
jgi:L,D-transpeptidase catalytic domain